MELFCSFITAVFNRETYLQKCIDSILAQTNRSFELILINDGSTDKSLEIISEYRDDRIKYFPIEHQGCWGAKNYGIQKAQGQFVCFIDSDDFISPDYLQNAISQINKYPQYDYYYPTALAITIEDGTLTDKIWRYLAYPPSEREKLIKLFWDKQIGGIPHAGAFIRSEVFSKYGLYNDSFFNLSDTAYIISNAQDIMFFMLPDLKTYYNRQHPLQTNTNYSERYRTFSEILDEIINKYPTEIFLNQKIEKNDPLFYQICIEKFMELANKTKHNEWYLQKARKYIEISRNNLTP